MFYPVSSRIYYFISMISAGHHYPPCAGPCWAMLGHAGPCWDMLDHNGPCWAMLGHLGHAGPYWAMLGHTGPLSKTLWPGSLLTFTVSLWKRNILMSVSSDSGNHMVTHRLWFSGWNKQSADYRLFSQGESFGNHLI